MGAVRTWPGRSQAAPPGALYAPWSHVTIGAHGRGPASLLTPAPWPDAAFAVARTLASF